MTRYVVRMFKSITLDAAVDAESPEAALAEVRGWRPPLPPPLDDWTVAHVAEDQTPAEAVAAYPTAVHSAFLRAPVTDNIEVKREA